jgi:hypothetical protein
MTFDILVFQMPSDESMKPIRLPGTLWNQILAAAQANGGLVQERFNASEARQFARAVRAALEQPPASNAPARFAVFNVAKADPGLPLRDPVVRPLVDQVLAVFDAGAVLTQRTTESALRVIPRGDSVEVGTAARKTPVNKLPVKTPGLSATEVLGPAR